MRIYNVLMMLVNQSKLVSGNTAASTFGLFGGGLYSTYSTYTDKYTYSGDTVVAGTVLGQARYTLAATGNSTEGIFGCGINSSTNSTNYTDKYT